MRLAVAGICPALLLLTVSASPLQQPAAAKGSIEGAVTRAGTGDPIPGARVTLTRSAAGIPVGAPQPPPPPPVRIVESAGVPNIASSTLESVRINSSGGATSVLTDSQGKFAVRDLDAGAYRVSVAANGYSRQEYGQRTSGGQGTPVHLNPGQTVRDVGISLMPTGTVSGRIRDNTGQPAVGVQIQIIKSIYNSDGQRTFQSAGSARSDDRGDYRLYWITPGRYYVMASSIPNPNAAAIVSSPNELTGNGIAPTFYPGTVDIMQASAVDVKPGADISGVDVFVTLYSSYRIRGRLIDTRTGQFPTSASITLSTPFLTGGTNNSTSGQSYNGQDGSFELRDVSPGPHIVRAQLAVASNTVTPGNAGTISAAGTTVSGQVALNVYSDVDGLSIQLSAGGSISGRLAMEGPAVAGPQGNRGLGLYRVRLRLVTDDFLTAVRNSMLQSQLSNEDGAFRIDGVLPGEYRLSVSPLPSEVYVKQARFNQSDVLNKAIPYSASDSGTLEILLSSRGGQIDGSVSDERQRGVPNIQAVLIPDRQRDRIDLYKIATTDANGRFSLRGIAPGEYHVFAWEAIDPYAYFDPDFMKLFEPKGKPVHIAESAKEVLDVRMIPAEP